MIKKILPLLLLSCSSLLYSDCRIQSDKLLALQFINHGAPIQSVAWCCDENFPDAPYAAVGGYPGTVDTVVRVFELEYNNSQACCTGRLVEKATLKQGTDATPELPGGYVNAVDWACSCTSLLAVGGTDGIVRIYLYDGTNDTLTWMNSYTVGIPGKESNVRTLKFLPECCASCSSPKGLYLAVGGDRGADVHEIHILRVEPDVDNVTVDITNVADAIFGNSVYSLDWCCDRATADATLAERAYLAAGGLSGVEGTCGKENVRVYCFDCASETLTLVSQVQAAPNPVYTVSWCCDPSYSLKRQLAVGGKRNDINNIMAQVFYFDNNINLKPVGGVNNGILGVEGQRTFAIEWNPSPCQCNTLTLGGGCMATTPTLCPDNIIIDKIINKCYFQFLTGTRFDDNITSLAYCQCDSNNAYLLVGSEKDNWSSADICIETPTEYEVALYCVATCGGATVLPKPICERGD